MVAIAVHDTDHEEHSLGFRSLGFAENLEEACGKMVIDLIFENPIPGATDGCFGVDYCSADSTFHIDHREGNRVYMFIENEAE